MTPQNKILAKRIALTIGILAVVTVLAILIIKNVKYRREMREQETENDAPRSTGSSGGNLSSGSSMNTLNGRTFTTSEVEKMQSYMLFLGQMAQNQYIIGQIRNTGGIDGKIGSGFKNALAECIRIKAVKDLDELYQAAIKIM